MENVGQMISINTTKKKELAYEILIKKDIPYTGIKLFRHEFIDRFLINKNKIKNNVLVKFLKITDKLYN